MKNSLITFLVVLFAIAVAGFLIFSGNTQQTIEKENYATEKIDKNQSQIYQIEIKNFAFEPQNLKIALGDSVVWTNLDASVHTVTSDFENELDSLYLEKLKNYSYIFTKPGVYSYHCTPHPGMKGKIIVE